MQLLNNDEYFNYQGSVKTPAATRQVSFPERVRGWRVAHDARNMASGRKALGSWEYGGGGPRGANPSTDITRKGTLTHGKKGRAEGDGNHDVCDRVEKGGGEKPGAAATVLFLRFTEFLSL